LASLDPPLATGVPGQDRPPATAEFTGRSAGSSRGPPPGTDRRPPAVPGTGARDSPPRPYPAAAPRCVRRTPEPFARRAADWWTAQTRTRVPAPWPPWAGRAGG